MSKVDGADFYFEGNWNMNLESAAVRHPRNPIIIIGVGKNVMNLLGEGHITDFRGVNVLGIFWQSGIVSVRVIHRASRSADELNRLGFFKVNLGRRSLRGSRRARWR